MRFLSGGYFARKYLLPLLALVLTACQPAIDTSTLPAPETWRAQVTPALRWLGPTLNECTRQVPGVALLYDEQPAQALDPQKADFTFSLEPASGAEYTAVLGQVGLAFIVNPASPVSQLDQAGLEAIFSGKAVTWAGLPQKDCPNCTSSSADAIKFYVYAPGDDLGRVFGDLFPALSQNAPSAILAPDPESVRQAVAADPQAFGYIPAPLVDSSVRIVKISDVPPERMFFSLILSMQAEPAGIKRSWVLCVQQALTK